MKKYSKKKVIKQIIKQGIHLWIILFLANVAILYSFTWFLQAEEEQLEQQSTLARREKPPTPTPTIMPGGPVIDFSFDMPGIGTNGANFKPLHPKRIVKVSLYTPEHNVFDPTVEPLHIINGQAIYDDNEKSPTYTRYLVNNFDLGDKVSNGSYQITLQTEQTVPLLLKEDPNAVGGTPYTLEKRKRKRDPLPPQVMIIGDIAPLEGNNVMDINDYNMFVNCYGGKETELCPQKMLADFDDNGIIDGVDYNLMVLSYKRLGKLGFPVPSIIISPTPQQVSKLSELSGTPAITATPAATTKPSKGGNMLGLIIGILFFLVIIGGAAFFFIKNKKLVKNFHDKLFPKRNTEEITKETAETTATETSEKASQMESTEQPVQETTESPAPENVQPQEQPVTTEQTSIDGDFYVKKQNADDQQTGFWVTLTDDNGPTLGFYKGDNLHEGFGHVKGTFQEENGKKYILITEVTPTD